MLSGAHIITLGVSAEFEPTTGPFAQLGAKSYFRSVVVGVIVSVKASQEIINDEVSHFAT